MNTYKSVSSCDAIYLGGPEILNVGGYYERIYANLNLHSIIYFSIRFIIVDDWRNGDYISISFDGNKLVSEWTFYQFKSQFPKNMCGNPGYKDLREVIIFGKVFHSSETLTVQILSGVNQHPNFASFGFRDINILLATRSPNDIEQAFAIADPNINLGSYGTPCNLQEYSQYNGPFFIGCLPCHINCNGCFGPGADRCYSCVIGTTFNGTHCVNCKIPGCKWCSSSNLYECRICETTHWLDWNNTCQSSCNSPLVQEGTDLFKTCNIPCQDGYFMQWDNVCINSCMEPLILRAEGKANFCEYPCQIQDFLYLNGSCMEKCEFPWEIVIIGGRNFCKVPCQDPTQFFYDDKKVCSSQCIYPRQEVIKLSIKTCVITPETQNEMDNLGKATEVGNILDTISSSTAFVSSLLIFTDSGALMMMTLVKMLQYVKYMKIQFTPQVQYMFDKQKENLGLFIFVPKLSQKQRNWFPKHSLPPTFEYYKVHSSFFVNFWQGIGSLILVLGVIGILYLIERNVKHGKVLQFTKKIKPAFRWNFVLTMFCSYFGDMALYTCLEFQTVHYDNALSVISFLICLIFNTIAFFVLKKILEIHLKARNSSKNKTLPRASLIRLEEIEKNLQAFKVIFDNFHQGSLHKRIFTFVFVIRAYLVNSFIGYLFNYPLIQSILIALISIKMIVYLILARPLKKLIYQIQQLTYEIVLSGLNISILVLAILDFTKSEVNEVRAAFGGIIILTNIIMRILPTFFVITKILLACKELWESRAFPEEYYDEEEFDLEKIRKLSSASKFKFHKNFGNFPKNCELTPSRKKFNLQRYNNQIQSFTSSEKNFVTNTSFINEDVLQPNTNQTLNFSNDFRLDNDMTDFSMSQFNNRPSIKRFYSVSPHYKSKILRKLFPSCKEVQNSIFQDNGEMSVDLKEEDNIQTNDPIQKRILYLQKRKSLKMKKYFTAGFSLNDLSFTKRSLPSKTSNKTFLILISLIGEKTGLTGLYTTEARMSRRQGYINYKKKKIKRDNTLCE